MKKKRASFCTLGCKVNQVETEAVTGLFKEEGYEIVSFTEEADVVVINTCTVTHLADRKSRQMIRRAIKLNPQAKVVVMGCYSQVSPASALKIPGVDLVIGTTEKSQVIELLRKLETSSSPLTVVDKLGEHKSFEGIKSHKIIDRTRAYLKIQEGCEQFCSYCIIPYARGPIRSRPVKNTINEARKLINEGFKEIILTGIHLGVYGTDLTEDIALDSLLEKLLPMDNNVRWRLSSLEPTEVSEKMLTLMVKYPDFCKHLHLPLQSAHNDILKLMNRPYTTEEYRDIVENIRKNIPDICITTDIMVGFPGETDRHFQDYLTFVKDIAFSNMHVFKYSPRRGTPAADFPGQVSPVKKEERSHELLTVAKELATSYAQKFVGTTLQVLVERKTADNLWEGHSSNYIKVKFTGNQVKKGEICPVKVLECKGEVCFGEVSIL